MTDQCNIEIGNSRYVQTTEWKGEARIDIREWELREGRKFPTKKGMDISKDYTIGFRQLYEII